MPEVQVYFLQQGTSYLAVAIDPEGSYLAGWSQAVIDEETRTNSAHTVGEFSLLSSRAHAQSLPLVLLLLKAVSTVSSARDLIAYLQDPPELVHWGVLYEDRCWSGEDLANYVGSAGLVLPGIDDVAGVLAGPMDEIARAIFLLSQHVIEEDAKDLLVSLDQPVRIRTYHLGIPVLGMVPVGWCATEAAPTVASTPPATAGPVSVPTLAPEGFRIASPTPPPMDPEFVISDGSAYEYNPTISGTIVVWYDALCRCNEAKDFSTGGQIRVSDHYGSQGYAAVSDRFVVWSDYRNGNSDIHCRNLATAEEFSIVTDPAEQTSPAISGSIVVWEDARHGGTDIYGKDLSRGQEFPVATHAADQRSPAISGSIVVWEDRRNGNWDIYGKDLATGAEFPVSTEEVDERFAAVSGNVVVWFEGSWAFGNLSAKDISVGERISIVDDGSADAKRPAIDGTIVAWVSYRLLDGWAIVAKDISTGTEYLVTSYSLSSGLSRPAVSGDLVVWGGISGYRGDICGRRLHVE
ncbi:MAG TPA: hypothetical protein VMW58_04485 [Anaerolineae bacterium]|nr:hypothetical protein [Anaerolineae bacterium]